MAVIRCRDCGLVVGGTACATCGWIVPAGYVEPARPAYDRRSTLSAWERARLDLGTEAVERGPAAVRRWWKVVRASSERPSEIVLETIAAACVRRGEEALDAKDRTQAVGWCRRALTLGRALAQLSVHERDEEDDEHEDEHSYPLARHLPGEELCARLMTAFGPEAGHPALGADRAARRFLRAQVRCWGTFAEAHRLYATFLGPRGRELHCECEQDLLDSADALARWVEILNGYVDRGWLQEGPALRPWLRLPPLPRGSSALNTRL